MRGDLFFCPKSPFLAPTYASASINIIKYQHHPLPCPRRLIEYQLMTPRVTVFGGTLYKTKTLVRTPETNVAVSSWHPALR